MINTAPDSLADGWPVASPGQSLDLEALREITAALHNGYEYPNVHALLIEHDGRLIYEVYLDGEDGTLGDRKFNRNSLHDLRSISKSVTALLLGMAFEDEIEAALARPVSEFIPDLAGEIEARARRISLHQVLTMSAGLEWDQWSTNYDDPENDESRMYAVDDPLAFTLGRPLEHAPGSVWAYNSGLTELLVTIIEYRIGGRLREFAYDRLFSPLGIDNFEWWGSWRWRSRGRPSSAAGLRMRPRDLARIGSLMLHEGRWQGERIVSPDWIRLLGQRHVHEAPAGHRLAGYGYQWWALKSGSIPPYEFIGGFGLGGQRLLIVPEYRLVLTVLAGNYDHYQQDMGNRILHRVVAARRNHAASA